MDITIQDHGTLDGWNESCIILYHGNSEIYFVTGRDSICKYMIKAKSNYYFETGSHTLSPSLQILFNDLWKYKDNEILNRFNTTRIIKESINNNETIKYIFLFILDVPSQRIHRISLLDRFAEYPSKPGVILSHLTFRVTLNKPALFVLLRLMNDQNDNKLYGIAMNISDNSYHQFIYEDYKSMDTSWNTKPIISTNASDLYASPLDIHSQWIITKSNFYPKYYIKYAVKNQQTYLLHWNSLFTMNLIRFNINTSTYNVDTITMKPDYSSQELIRSCASNTNSNFKKNLLTFTVWSRLFLFITPLYDNNFYIAFIDVNIYQIYLYHVHNKQMMKCNNPHLLSRLRKSMIQQTHGNPPLDSLSINITDMVDNNNLVNGYIRLIIATNMASSIPHMMNCIVLKYCVIQQVYICRCNVGQIFSFNVDELFIY